MENLEGVREYNRIRRYLECIYLYGFFSREDFARAGIGSVKDYDYGTKLIRSIFPGTEQTAVWQDGHKYLRFQREYAESGELRISDSYLLAAMDVKDVLPTLIGLLASIGDQARTIDEICVNTAIRTQVQNNLNYHTVRRWLTELVEYGYVEKQGRKYKLADSPFGDLPLNSLLDLYEYTCLIAGVSYPRVAGSFLKRTIERELCRRGENMPGKTAFLLRHSVMRCVFDEEMIYQIMDCMEQQCDIEINLGDHKMQAQPAAIRADTRLGRWYLLAVTEEGPWMVRISAITALKKKARKAGADLDKWKDAIQNCRAAFAHTGCSGALPQTGPEIVRVRLDFEDSPGMRNQFERELRIGTIIQDEGGQYYQAEINDPIELTPFLRAYSPWITILPGKNGLAERIRSDLEAMLADLQDDGSKGNVS